MDNEIRFDPILREWVIVAKKRTKRPVLGKTFSKDKKKYICPFCPDAPEGAGEWIVKWVPNKFSSLLEKPEVPFSQEMLIDDFYQLRSGKGKCEVFLYTQDHNKSFGDLDLPNIEALILLWKERLIASMEDPELKYTFIFENRGDVIGVSLSHPHGQLYSFPFIPPKIQKAFDSAKDYNEKHNECVYCKVIQTEKKSGSRIIEENEDFIAFIPFFAKWPFEIHIYPKDHYSQIKDIPQSKSANFAIILKNVVKRLDGLYGFIMPYVFSHHNAPYNIGENGFYHYHIEIYPPYRAKDRIKYLAGVELGTHTIINPTSPADNAKLLRDVEI